MLRRIFCIVFTAVILISACSVTAFAYTPANFEIEAEGALLVNSDTGDVLFSKNADKQLYPASLTKLMTALLLFEHTTDIDEETVTVSENALKLLEGTDSSVGGLAEGEVLTVRQMLYVLLLSSANDGANAIAENVAGDISSFVKLMNERAKQLGMDNTHFNNAHGLHDVNHYTTVNDMYKLTKTFLSVGVLREIVGTTKYTLPKTNKSKERNYTSTNLLLLNNGTAPTAGKYKGKVYYYKYAQGVKTGYTDAAGRCLISCASKNGYNYICILMNSPVYDGNNTKVRYEFGDSKALYDWAFNDFEYKTIVNGGEIISEVPVEVAWNTDHVQAAPSDGLSAIVPKAVDASTITTEIHWYKESYDAPIKKGDILGECDVMYAGEVLGTVTLVSTEDVDRSFIMYIGRGIGRLFSAVVHSTPFIIILVLLILALVVFLIICVMINSPRRRRRRRRFR